jgi:predicted peptidase
LSRLTVPFVARQVAIGKTRANYRVFEPAGKTGPLPVILFLHGRDESGLDSLAPTTVGIGPAIQRDPERFPALVVFPTATSGHGWRGANLTAALAALEDVLKSYPTDPARVYLTGISMGGYGTWLLALQHPNRFAAIVPICGGLDRRAAGEICGARETPKKLYEAAAERIASIPQWIFHGDADAVVPVKESRMMVDALARHGAKIRYTEYAGVGHNAWDAAYAEPELMPWLLGRTMKS